MMNKFINYSKALTDGIILSSINVYGLDIYEIVDSGIFDNIPGIGVIISTGRSIMSIRDRLFIKKFVKFLQEFNTMSISESEREKFRKKFQEDELYRIEITECLISYIDDFKRLEKAEILARLFAEYIKGTFPWEHFLDLSDLLSKINISNLMQIPQIDTKEGKEVQNFDEQQSSVEADLISSGLAMRLSIWSSCVYPTSLGKDLYTFGVKSKGSN